MRIAYIDPTPIPGTSPPALQILHTVDALGECGVEVELVTPLPRRQAEPSKLLAREISSYVDFNYLPDLRKRWWNPSSSNKPFYWQAARVLKKLKVHGVLVRNLKLAEYLLKKRGMPPIFFETHELFAQSFTEHHGLDSWGKRRKLKKIERREKFVYEHCAGLIGITQSLLDDIHERYGIETPSVVSPDGVDMHLASKAAPSRNKPKPVLLYLGSLHPWKGVETLIHAMEEINGAQLVIAGGNDKRIVDLQNLAEEISVSSKVTFLGPVPPAERFDIIAQADICLLPLTQSSIGSRYTSPLKLFEYLAMGKPIVTADVPALREVLKHGQNALLVPPENANAIAAAVNQLLNNDALRNQLGAAAAELAKSYSWEARAKIITRFMTQTLTAPKRLSRPSMI